MIVYTVSALLGGGDQELEGVFSTREKADAYAEVVLKAGRLACVEEFEIDALCGHRMREMFACTVNRDGEIRQQWSYEVVAGDDEQDSTDQFAGMFTGRSIKSAERAEELAREALKAWIIEIEEAGR